MDRHDSGHATAEDLAAAHQEDLKHQAKFSCKAITYWFDEMRGTAFCLIEAPTAAAVREMHRAAHGLIPNEIIEVDPATVKAFLGRITDPEAAALPVREPAFRAIMFTDMVDSTGLTNALGDEGALAVVRQHDEVIRRALLAHGGREVDRAGDGFLVSFGSVSQAVGCAIAIQMELASQVPVHPDAVVRVRIGIGAGEPVAEGDGLFGSTVNLTARICSHAAPGQILVAGVVRELCAGKPFIFRDQGKASLKGFPVPIRLHEVAWSA
jgi:class 3 adenylate cyclase